ncbi:MAG TPA: hypothetical protein DCG38_01815 [Eubacteriaceae bacterium]|jgi:hypothetical protein|nr:hypothetical protein [Eubacteriaceae bacterium]
MENKKIIDEFHISDGSKKKNTGKKIPEIIYETREPIGSEDGTSLNLVNYKAFRIIIDGVEYKEAEFKKLFPNKYPAFNIKKTLASKNEALYETMYMYFPAAMLKKHKIRVICRKKMIQYTYELK